MNKTIKRILKVIAVMLFLSIAVFVLLYPQELLYGYRQASGQIKLLRATESRKTFLGRAENKKYTENILLIDEMKRYAVDSLGLAPSDSYVQCFDQKGKPIMWVITASKPYALEPKEWRFPLFGAFPYKGFFDSTFIKPELQKLKQEGYEYRVGQASAWSTLGILSDPILSSFLDKAPGDLAELIFHELTHGTVFIKNDLSFNENLAEFIGSYGAKRFLAHKFGPNSPELNTYLESQRRSEQYLKAITEGALQLDSLYKSFPVQLATTKKDILKYALITKIMQKAYGRDSVDITGINNAYFTGVNTYHSNQDYFNKLLNIKFEGNFLAFLAYIKENERDLSYD